MRAFGIVYVHINKINGKAYVGQTCQLSKRRWRRSGNGTNNEGYKTCTVFYRALQKYTWANFETIELCSCFDQSGLNAAEEFFMRLYNSLAPNGYNALDRAGDKVIYTAEVRAKLSAARLGFKTGIPSWNRTYHTEKENVMGKECSSCKEWKTLDAFCKDKGAKWDGLAYYCKVCHATRQREYWARQEKMSETDLEQSYKDRSVKMAASIKSRFDNDPEYKLKISKATSKAIVATNAQSGEVLEFPSALSAKSHGFVNTRIGEAIKQNKPYKGYMWKFKVA